MLGGISIWQLLIVFVIVILVFGTKKLRNLGGDLGGTHVCFGGAVRDDDAKRWANLRRRAPGKTGLFLTCAYTNDVVPCVAGGPKVS